MHTRARMHATHICAYVGARMHVSHTSEHTYTYIRTPTHMHTHIHARTWARTCTYVHTDMHTRTYTHTHTDAHTHTHTHIHTHRHRHTHTHIHTHTYRRTQYTQTWPTRSCSRITIYKIDNNKKNIQYTIQSRSTIYFIFLNTLFYRIKSWP